MSSDDSGGAVVSASFTRRFRPAHVPESGSAVLRGLGLAALTAVLLTVILCADLLPREYAVHEGDVSAFSIRAPRKISYTSAIATRRARDQAAQSVVPVLELDQERITGQRRQLADLIQAIRTARGVPNQTSSQRMQGIDGLSAQPFSEPVATRLATMTDADFNAVATDSQRLLQDVLTSRIADQTAAEETRQTLPLRANATFSETDRAVVAELTGRFVRPNVMVNEEATARARQDAQDAVAPVQQTYERGQTVVRDGQIIGPLELEALEVLGLTHPELDWYSVFAAAALAVAVVGVLAAYIWHYDRQLISRERRMILLASLLLLTAVAAKMVIPNRPLWVYIFPLPAVSMLVAILLDARLAILMGMLISAVFAWIAGMSLEVGAIGLLGTVVGALSTSRGDRLVHYFVAGVNVAVVEVLVAVAFFLTTRSEDWRSLGIIVFELGANGLISSILAVGSFAIIGRLFGILTSMQLLELANPTQPLLRRLLMEAPGTYHHSIMVGNLAERAADVIGADSLLVRVAAYYHDVGKLERPWAFIENQANAGGNIHQTLDPEASARLIAAHVTDGVKLAERAKLPARVRQLIPQHHGTRRISFFYQQAAEASETYVDPDPFTYPGPRPQSREAAILMLADSTEAAARAAQDHSRDAIERLVDELVRQRLDEGQFDECDITLRDLTLIKSSFVTLLAGIYHLRIPYPPASSQDPSAPARATVRSERGA